MSRHLYAAAVLSSFLLSTAHAQSPFTPAPLGEDILQKARDWQAAPNPKPPTEFRAGHVTPRKLGKDSLQAKPGGFEVALPSGAPLTTPTVYDGKVFSSGGFHSKEFYAVDAKTGQQLWSLWLGDARTFPIAPPIYRFSIWPCAPRHIRRRNVGTFTSVSAATLSFFASIGSMPSRVSCGRLRPLTCFGKRHFRECRPCLD